jgi:hypothetical protein
MSRTRFRIRWANLLTTLGASALLVWVFVYAFMEWTS